MVVGQLLGDVNHLGGIYWLAFSIGPPLSTPNSVYRASLPATYLNIPLASKLTKEAPHWLSFIRWDHPS